MFDKATDQLLEDIKTTLEGDVPILVCTWSDRVDAKGLGSTSLDDYQSCGCLMMNGSVEEFNSLPITDPCARSHTSFLSRKYGLSVTDISNLAGEFDRWAEEGIRRLRIVPGYAGSRKAILTDGARRKLLSIVRGELTERGITA